MNKNFKKLHENVISLRVITLQNYNRIALKISLTICLILFGFGYLITLVKATPPSGYDFGRKQAIYHEVWWQTLWVLHTRLAVDYTNEYGDYIQGWTTQTSGAYIYSHQWRTYGYSSSIQTSTSQGGYYSWVKFMNQAYFESTCATHKGLAKGWNIIYVAFQYDGDSSWTQYTQGFLWILKYNHLW